MDAKAATQDAVLGRLAGWVAGAGLETWPAAAVERARLFLLDTLGCAIAGLGHPAVGPVRGLLAGLGAHPAASVIGRADRAPATSAVLVNGACVRALDLNDFYWSLAGGGGHPSDNIPVALAVAEERGLGGKAALAAILAGYEVYCRLADLMDTASPWDHVGASGLAGAAMAGRLMGLPPDRLAHALALGATYAHPLAALRKGGISQAKAVSNALVAVQGMLGALLAEGGLTGPLAALEGPQGLPATLMPGADLATLVPAPGDAPRILDVAVKIFPCIGTGQSAVAAAIELRRRLGDRGRLRSLLALLPDAPVVRVQSQPGYRRPQDRETADHSFYFLIAAALVDGELTPRQFAGDRWNDPEILRIMDAITVRPEPLARGLSGFPARLVAELHDGGRIEIDVADPPGSPAAPADAATVIRKFQDCVAGALPDARAAEVVEMVLGLERLASLEPLMAILRGARAPDAQGAQPA